MEIGRWQQIEQVYNRVLDAPSERRSALLDEACSGDPDLRREVESLLSASDEAHSFLSNQELKGHISQLTAEPAVPVLGTTVGRYQVLSLLGAGAMGEVYLAHDTSLDRQVALKLLPRQYTQDPERVARFVREAKAASSLNHPNIITIYETGQIGDTWFISAEYIPGGTLRDRMANGVLPSQAIEIVLQCAGALAAAHRAGVVHRDIKPENIMVRPDGVAKVVDFGLARMVEARPESMKATQTGSVMGTPRYMSPEQAHGQKPDARSDIFSLGAVLYEMIAGRPAFPGATAAEVFAALLDSEPDAAGAGPLDGVIYRALAKDPAARYQSMEEFAGALRSFDAAEPQAIAARPSRRWQFSSAARKAAFTTALVAVAGLAGYSWMALHNARPSEALAIVPLTTTFGSKQYPAFSPDARRIAFSWRASNKETNHIYVKPVANGEPVQLTFGSEEDTFPTWSPDGRQIAFCRRVPAADERSPGTSGVY
ncbi:MAG TPA: protein kinase, partial [Verrucomicrobiae bacterium]